jgi:hypothetical protein
MWIKYSRARRATDDNIIRHIRWACWITKVNIQAHTQTMQYVLYFHGNSGYANASLSYLIRALPILLCYGCEVLSHAEGEEYADLSFVRLVVKCREYFETKHF